MTLPSRKKLQITVQSIRSQVKAPSAPAQLRRAALRRGLWLGVLLASSDAAVTTQLQAQSPGWQPNRLPNSAQMQPLSSAVPSSATPATATSSAAGGEPNSGVVLRWRTSARMQNVPAQNQPLPAHNQAPSAAVSVNTSSLAARALESNTVRPASAEASEARFTSGSPSGGAVRTASSNPLRSTTATTGSTSTGDAGLRNSQAGAPTFVPRGAATVQRSVVQPANFQAPAGNFPSQGGGLSESVSPPSFPIVPQDALNAPEAAPAPPTAPLTPEPFPQTPSLEAAPAQDNNPAAPMPDDNNQLRGQDNTDLTPNGQDSPDSFKNRRLDDAQSPNDRDSIQRSRDLEKKRDMPDSSANCEAFRDKLRSASIQKINLNAAPRYGQGINDRPEETEKQRLDFASSSEVRDWCDRHGKTIIQGRMIDLVNEQVVLDTNGLRREIPLRDLCDVDLAYVGKVWNLPVTCGSGYETVPGRDFVPSAIQWKASGLCHKPLYFEEVQLERYGHEIGPVLQPLVSTAHFFGNIAVLPYKMGIHPPHECQYALGYYRPGDCAPYMLPPVPISLRGAAVQAGAVVGAAALVP